MPVQRLPVPALVQRVVGSGAVAIVLGSVQLTHRPATLCPFRALTGLPCPLCGSTTMVADVGRLRIGAAVLAAPVTLVALVVVVLVGPDTVANWLQKLPRQVRIGSALALVLFSEVWQLARFGFI